MRNKYILSALIICFGVIISSFIISDATKVEAQTSTIQYPVAELDNCKNEADCRSFCDNSAHADICFAFAEKHNLMSQEEIQMAKKFMKVGKGPGNCSSKEECDKYCNDNNHMNECISFAEKNGIMSGKELEEAKKVQAAIAKGVKPPACNGKDECDKYCSDSAHMEECIAFSQAAGLMSDQELQDSQKMLSALKKGAKPPACKGKEECDKYCSDSAHIEECMTFAIAAGFMSEQEAQNSQKMLEAIRKGVKPPACKGKEECDKFCGDPAHTEECIAFSVAAGMMSPEEAAMAKKTGGKGPGGCSSKEACETFCNDPANQETCFNFGKDNGMIPQEELQKMEEGKKQFSGMLNQAPAETITCISNAVGSDNLEKFKSGSAMPPRDIGDKIGQCFRMNQQPGGPGEGGNIPPAGQGSGDAKQQFQPGPGAMNPGGQMMPQQAGPGGCKTPEECQSFCKSNPDACKNFNPGGNQNMPTQQPNAEQMKQVPGKPGPGMGIEGNFMPGSEEFKTNEKGQYVAPGMPNIPDKIMDINNMGPGSMPNVQQMQQQYQQPMQQFQPGPSGPPPGGEMMGPPPSGDGGGTPPPPTTNPPAGGSLLNAVKSFFGF